MGSIPRQGMTKPSLLELAVVLFFLAEILGFLLEPNTNGGRQLLCSSEPTHEQ
jgi:hypothetical protein